MVSEKNRILLAQMPFGNCPTYAAAVDPQRDG
jgi:hypothetical protein